ncbi:MAG: hypothetical protein U0905_18245 [Pirellulales bacterium]
MNEMRTIVTVIGLLILALSGVAWTTGSWNAIATITQNRPTRTQMETVFSESFEPILKAREEANRESRERCILRIRDQFAAYRQSIDPFTDDITSLWTRMGVLRRMPADWWNEDGRVDRYVSEKFQHYFFDDEQLALGIQRSLEAFREDLRADRALMLSRIKVAIQEKDLPEVTIPETEFESSVQRSMEKLASRRASDSVYQGISTFIVSDVAMTVATSIVTRVATSLGTSAAASAAAAGGSTAGSAAIGAGGGSLAGPAGTAIGLGVGLVVGAAVDWWMTDSFRGHLRTELQSYLFQLEHGILFGNGQEKGLESDLDKLLLDLANAEREVLHQKWMETIR